MSKISATAVTTAKQFELAETKITAEFTSKHSIYEALRQEIIFILKDAIDKSAVKIHDIESRVKTLPSLLSKCVRKETNDPLSDVTDIAAARVICLFRSDIEELKKIVSEVFEVIEIEDKIEGGQDPLNYLSVHIICKMKDVYSGPRYDKIIGTRFEIQIRTLCMHCWAAVSHYVSYKGEWDVPANLRMALSALSGLFYVADSEFENFNAAMLMSKKSAESGVKSAAKPRDINLDTVSALLRRLYPRRVAAGPASVSEFVKELKKLGEYDSFERFESDLEKASKQPLEYETNNKKGAIYFIDVGAARSALASISPQYARLLEDAGKAKTRSKKPSAPSRN